MVVDMSYVNIIDTNHTMTQQLYICFFLYKNIYLSLIKIIANFEYKFYNNDVVAAFKH